MRSIKKDKRKIGMTRTVTNNIFYYLVLFLLLAQVRCEAQVNLNTMEDIPPRFIINDTHDENLAGINDIGTFIEFVLSCYAGNSVEEIAKCVVDDNLKKCYFEEGVEASGEVIFCINFDGKVDVSSISFEGKFNDYSKDFLKDVLLKSSPYWQPRQLNHSMVRSKRMNLPVMITSKKGRFPDEMIDFYHRMFSLITSNKPNNVVDLGAFCLLKPIKYYVQY